MKYTFIKGKFVSPGFDQESRHWIVPKKFINKIKKGDFALVENQDGTAVVLVELVFETGSPTLRLFGQKNFTVTKKVIDVKLMSEQSKKD